MGGAELEVLGEVESSKLLLVLAVVAVMGWLLGFGGLSLGPLLLLPSHLVKEVPQALLVMGDHVTQIIDRELNWAL